ncbi:MAG: hypothetical protein GXY83_44115 [Rhodopirellula sp.]|nr:hypothetical protein [Rhodopirellula sp.]
MTLSAFVILLCTTPGADAPLALGATRELFLDDALIATSRNITRRVHSAEKHPGNPLLRPTESWEGEDAILYGSVLREEGKYRMWYHVARGVAYAESPDGLAWAKPRLDAVRIDGRKTNLVIHGKASKGEPGWLPYFYEVFGVHRDDRDPDPTRRYKMGFLSIDREYRGPLESPFHPERRGLGVAASSDGIHWRLLDSFATHATIDGATHWCWDQTRGKYLLFGRTKHLDPKLLEVWKADDWVNRYYWGRSVIRAESADFLHWNFSEHGKAPLVMTADAQDPPGTEIYSMLVFPYESVYLGLVQMFHNRADACHLDIQLAVSRDGLHFSRVSPREPFLPVGPVASWDRYNQSLANNPPPLVGEVLRFYYGGRTQRHGPYRGPDIGQRFGGVGVATVPRDRFVSLGASFDGGEIVTQPLRMTGARLHLNAKADFGQIVVEALDPTGKMLARSQPVRADGLDLPVAWETGSSQQLTGQVALRITLRNALLFSLWSAD